MDPNEARRRLSQAIEELAAAPAPEGSPLARYGPDIVEHWRALDEWLSRGGFLPLTWSRAQAWNADGGE